jgi:hypothetical protein
METMDNDNDDKINRVRNLLLQLEFNNNETEDPWRPGGPVISRWAFVQKISG